MNNQDYYKNVLYPAIVNPKSEWSQIYALTVVDNLFERCNRDYAVLKKESGLSDEELTAIGYVMESAEF